jgi:glycosyltransferase involved in cell wall biosynthesis
MSVTSKIALVVDALPALGGAEKVLMAALELFPDAPIYSLLYNQEAFADSPLADRQVVTSFIERLPLARSHYRNYLPFMPLAMRRFDLSAYDTILSFSYAVAHGVQVAVGQKHLSYTYTPMRYVWNDIGRDGKPRHPSLLLDEFFRCFRAWDVSAASHVDEFAAVSGWVSGLIQRAYQRPSTVIYPPVEVGRFHPQVMRDDYFVTIARLVPHKRIDLLVEAFNRMRLPLLVIGDGPERKKLARRAADNIRFLGFQSDSVVESLLSQARAYVCPGEEDFGIAIVEAQAAGCPVIAYGNGGACEIVIENQTGLFFADPTPESLIETTQKFIPMKFSIHDCSRNVTRFNRQRFLSRLERFVGLC